MLPFLWLYVAYSNFYRKYKKLYLNLNETKEVKYKTFHQLHNEKFKDLTTAAIQAYPFHTTEKNVVWIAVLNEAAKDISRAYQAVRLFLCLSASVYGRAEQGPQGRWCLTSTATCSVPPTMIAVVVGGSLNELEAHIMTATDLVPVFTGTIQHQSVQLCNARDLHKFLESQRQFANWIKERIEQYGFTEGEDFLTILLKTSKGTKGGRPTTEYHLTLDMAKELAMVENNEKGRQIRRYFISLERSNKPALPDQSAQAEQLAKQIEERLLKSLPVAHKLINPPVWTRPAPSCGEGNDRNIEVAKKLITELKGWANTLPHDVGSPLWDALDDLSKLLVTGWTEVDEALLHISVGANYLKRWMGRGK
ncbi:antA/AntB antirepressor family protein [Nitrosomonas communis]|nr:antA/AntB antirepressor family protein [Nitrosomonas communis]